VRRLLAFGTAAVAAFGLVRLLASRRRHEPAAPDAGPDPRADELRRRLAESRAVVDERERFEGGETTVDAAEPAPPADPGARRRRVHESGRAVVDQMRGDTPTA
jgi:hypothetical protein